MLGLQRGNVDGQNAQLDVEKHDGELKILGVVLVRSVNCGRIRNRESSKEKYLQLCAKTCAENNKSSKSGQCLVQSVGAKNSVEF